MSWSSTGSPSCAICISWLTSALIQPRTIPVKFASSAFRDPPGERFGSLQLALAALELLISIWKGISFSESGSTTATLSPTRGREAAQLHADRPQLATDQAVTTGRSLHTSTSRQTRPAPLERRQRQEQKKQAWRNQKRQGQKRQGQKRQKRQRWGMQLV